MARIGRVLAFTMIEKPDDVARVERSAANRMASVRGWVGWRVMDINVNDDADELVRLTVQAEPVGAGYRPDPVTYEFLVDQSGARRSSRLDAFFYACGIRERVDDTREIVGRYFSTRNRGRSASDFGSLTNALVG
ncbi:hypothetical protein AJ87_24360 [Rhizobium yanglingense]|nr:hypothetical protein AJ87_24360 [Rhizobium yanglingense]